MSHAACHQPLIYGKNIPNDSRFAFLRLSWKEKE